MTFCKSIFFFVSLVYIEKVTHVQMNLLSLGPLSMIVSLSEILSLFLLGQTFLGIEFFFLPTGFDSSSREFWPSPPRLFLIIFFSIYI